MIIPIDFISAIEARKNSETFLADDDFWWMLERIGREIEEASKWGDRFIERNDMLFAYDYPDKNSCSNTTLWEFRALDGGTGLRKWSEAIAIKNFLQSNGYTLSPFHDDNKKFSSYEYNCYRIEW